MCLAKLLAGSGVEPQTGPDLLEGLGADALDLVEVLGLLEDWLAVGGAMLLAVFDDVLRGRFSDAAKRVSSTQVAVLGSTRGSLA